MQSGAREILALVAGGVDYGEADRVVHLLTSDGALSAFAHGAKKSKRRFSGCLEPFTTIRAQLTESRRARGAMPTLAQAQAERVRLELRGSLEAIALGSYALELSRAVSPEGQDATAQFTLTEALLDHLEAAPATVALRRAFELKTLVELGYAPDLGACAVCGRDDLERAWLDLVQGGVLCPLHRGQAREVGPKTLAWARAVLEAEGILPDGYDDAWAETAAQRLAIPVGAMWAEVLDRPLKSVALLDSVLGNPGTTSA